MRRTIVISTLALLLTGASIFGQSETPSPQRTDSEILKILADRVDAYHWSVGMVVGVIEPAGRRIVAYGKLDKDDPRPLNGDTVFEIGSITKVFTSLLLADMVQRGEVSLDDPITKYLPEGVKTPERNGRSITLVDLSTHTSGLPQVLGNPDAPDTDNPYTGYSLDQLYRFLSTFQLRRDVGSQFEYSNLGIGLLGHLLTRKAEMDYEMLLKSRVTGPLGMSDTRITLPPEMTARLAVGHSGTRLRPVAPWDMPTLSAAGALRSTANDLLTLLAAELGFNPSPLATAMDAMLKIRRPTGDRRADVALGWLVYSRAGNQIIGHGGDTTGFQSAIAFDPKTRAGVVVLSNSSTFHGITDIALHLLDPGYSLERPAPVEAAIDPAIFDRYAGRYELQGEPRLALTFTREDDHFFIQASGQAKLELFSETARDFFLKVTDAQITFEVDNEGRGVALVLHQNGQDEIGKRID